MTEGADVITQAHLAEGRWHGRADVLLKVAAGSKLGAWSYEVVDTKLASETKAWNNPSTLPLFRACGKHPRLSSRVDARSLSGP